jgi:signal transduction histidine kinase
MLKEIFVQVERASGTVRDLLDFTRKDQASTEPVDVAELVGSSLKLVENECALAKVESENLIKEDLPKVRGNFRSLQQVILNIFINAIQAMPDGGRLRMDARCEEPGWLRIDLADSGVGIPKEILERVFDPFFTTKEVGIGTGLGLSVSYGIIEKMGGRITVDSEVGRGTTFSVFLPIWEDESQSPNGTRKVSV